MLDFLQLLVLPFVYIFDVLIFKYIFEIAYAIILLGFVWRLVKIK